MLLFLLLVLGPLADLVLLIRFGQAYGFLVALELVLGTAVIGAALLRAPGVRVTTRVAGVLLFLPGLITDVAGLALLFPPTRWLLVAATRGWVARATKNGALRVSFLRWQQGAPSSGNPAPDSPPATPQGLDPRNEILVPPPEGGGDRSLR
jgi:UPF0716 protein FxsA